LPKSSSLILGEVAPLSPSTVVRLKAEWQEDFKTWQQQCLEAEYLFVWVVGACFKAGPRMKKGRCYWPLAPLAKAKKGVLAI